jgi:hypothetical protein
MTKKLNKSHARFRIHAEENALSKLEIRVADEWILNQVQDDMKSIKPAAIVSAPLR